MRKFLAGLALAGVLVVGYSGLGTAQASDPYAKLQRQVNVLKAKVAALQNEVYRCEFVDLSTPTQFSDGSYGYPLYEDAACTS